MPQLPAVEWWDRGACRDVDPNIFNPKSNQGRRFAGATGPKPRDWSAAQEVCGRCPVRDACLEFTLRAAPPGDAGGIDYLFAAGLTPEQLMAERARRAGSRRR